MGNYEQALSDYNEAIRVNPKHTYAYYNRGIVYINKKDYDRAIADFEFVLSLEPNHSSAQKNLDIAISEKKKHVVKKSFFRR